MDSVMADQKSLRAIGFAISAVTAFVTLAAAISVTLTIGAPY